MKLTNGEIFNAREPLTKLMEAKFPVKTAFGLVKMARKLDEHLQDIEKVRQGLFQTYGTPDPKNMTQIRVEQYIPDPDEGQEPTDAGVRMKENPKWPKFREELTELFNQEVEVVLEPVALPEKVAATCDKCSHNMDKALEVEPATMMALEKFITVE
uniref:Uncharacterized protein n=1 Tax=viral metagenome TaxID=1070528 RepID=A0A6M3LTQ2_9ZZZZ